MSLIRLCSSNLLVLAVAVMVCITTITGYGQERPTPNGNTTAIRSDTNDSKAFVLENETPLKLRLTRNLSSADAKVDERVDFEVLDDIKVGDLIVIERGAMATATVTEAQPKRSLGRAGKLNVNIDSVRLKSGEKAALRAIKDVSGGGHTGAMTGAIVATSIVFFPAAPLFLFVRGKDITIPKGTEITAYTSGNMTLDPTKFAPKLENTTQLLTPSPSTMAQATAEVQKPSTILVKSDPDGADITVDGRYVGSTSSMLKLFPGEHAISIAKTGFKSWERTITVSPGGDITVNATLKKIP